MAGMKLVLALMAMMGEEETQRLQEIRELRQREARAKSFSRFRQKLACGARKTFVFHFGTTVVFYVVINTGRLQDYTGQVGQKLSARVNSHSLLKQDALQYQNYVDEISK